MKVTQYNAFLCSPTSEYEFFSFRIVVHTPAEQASVLLRVKLHGIYIRED